MDDELEVKEASTARRCAIKLAVHLCSHAGLVSLVVAYTLSGAVLFEFIEGGRGLEQRGLIQHSREECLKELWTITERLNVLYERNWTNLVHEQLRKFENNIVAATKTSDGDQPLDLLESSSSQWSFSSAFLYSVTIITTIGYGNLAPKTVEGKVLTMVYAFFGVPLMLLCLSSLGQLLARAVQLTYSKSLNDSDTNTRTKDCSTSHARSSADVRQYTHRYQRAPTSPTKRTSTCTSAHDAATVQLAASHHSKNYPTKKNSPVALATVNSYARGRYRLTTRASPLSSSTIAHSPSPPPPPPPTQPDIEDADETEDQDNSSVSHDTPSRVPLIWRQEPKNSSSSSHPSSMIQASNVSPVPIIIVLIFLIAYLCCGAAMFSTWENWTFLDAAYFCFVTLSTIGFGDLVPAKTFPKSTNNEHLQILACCLYLVLGLVLLAMSFSLVHDEVMSKCKSIAKALNITNRH